MTYHKGQFSIPPVEPEKFRKRYAELFDSLRDGASLRETAKRFKLSHTRVAQLVKKAGYKLTRPGLVEVK